MHLKKFVVTLTLFATIVLMAGTADAQITARVRQTTPEGLPGYITSDILLDFDGRYTGSQMIIELTSGDIYQNAHAGRPGNAAHTPPASFLLGLEPIMAWDTFLANGGPTAEDTEGVVGISGAAINVHEGDTNRPFAISDTATDIGWFANVGQEFIDDRDGFMTARITLSDDANGTLRYFASASGFGPQELVTASGAVIGGGGDTGILVPIINGVLGVPEPSTFVLLGMGLVGVFALKRRNG